jgi:hypothetical protein
MGAAYGSACTKRFKEAVVTTLMLEHLGPPAGSRELRRRECARRQALDALGGRTVWWATALPAGHAEAQARCDGLRGRGEVVADRLEITVSEPLRGLVEQLEAMLHGLSASDVALGAEQEEVYAGGSAEGDALVGGAVGPDDVVVLCDSAAALLAQPVRERGAHVVWQVTIRPRREPGSLRAWRFVHRAGPTIDAYAATWSTPLPRGCEQRGVAAFMAAPDAVAASETTSARGAGDWNPELGWSRLLADVVRGGREEHVGGTRHARPAVAAR